MIATTSTPPAAPKGNFEVWGTKWLHFLRPDVYPILDSLVRAAIALPVSHEYINGIGHYRALLMANMDVMAGLASDDVGSPTLLKRFNKVLYQRGLELKQERRTQ